MARKNQKKVINNNRGLGYGSEKCPDSHQPRNSSISNFGRKNRNTYKF
jgi:hypothetical protein